MVVPLLCKRFKQRNERHLIEHFGCRLKQNGYGDLGIILVSKLWGEATRNLAFSFGSDCRRLTPLTTFGLLAVIARQCDITISRLLISFFLFFLCQTNTADQKDQPLPSAPTKRKTTTPSSQPTTPQHTRPHTHKKSDSICQSYP